LKPATITKLSEWKTGDILVVGREACPRWPISGLTAFCPFFAGSERLICATGAWRQSCFLQALSLCAVVIIITPVIYEHRAADAGISPYVGGLQTQ